MAAKFVIYEVVRDELEKILFDAVPVLADFRADLDQRAQALVMDSWSSYCRKQEHLDKTFLTQCQKSEHSLCAATFDLWAHVSRSLRSGKLKLMNPPTNIEGLTLPSPLDLLRRTRGDLASAKDLQQSLQIQVVVAVLGNRGKVSNSLAEDLLEHANGDTARALQAGT